MELSKRPGNRKVKRFQYTAIDDATWIRALKIHLRHTQQNAIDFVKYFVDKPIRSGGLHNTVMKNAP